jgi:hypothetical protein
MRFAACTGNREQVGRSSTRPVLKHGPRSLTCARVRKSCLGYSGEVKAMVRSVSSDAAQHRGLSCFPRKSSATHSAYVGTRKMVNYAWARRSQRKLWWRSVAILTCKSIVRPGYRGERLIEPSSSWFLLKFPSG